MTSPGDAVTGDRVRVFAVVNLRRGRVHGLTCDVNQSRAWVREICERYNDRQAAIQCVDLVNPAEQSVALEPSP
jgi:hypothetical protein